MAFEDGTAFTCLGSWVFTIEFCNKLLERGYEKLSCLRKDELAKLCNFIFFLALRSFGRLCCAILFESALKHFLNQRIAHVCGFFATLKKTLNVLPVIESFCRILFYHFYDNLR